MERPRVLSNVYCGKWTLRIITWFSHSIMGSLTSAYKLTVPTTSMTRRAKIKQQQNVPTTKGLREVLPCSTQLLYYSLNVYFIKKLCPELIATTFLVKLREQKTLATFQFQNCHFDYFFPIQSWYQLLERTQHISGLYKKLHRREK